MAVITITLPNEIKNRLEEVDNKSSLIARLLSEYFSNENLSLEGLQAKKRELEETTVQKNLMLDNQIKLTMEKLAEKEEMQKSREKLRRIQEAIKEGNEELALKISRGEQ